MGKKAQNPSTEADKRAAGRLRAIWENVKRNEGLTQTDLASRFGEVTQGAISHYMTGRTPLGPVATLKFAKILNCKPTDIREDFEFSIIPGDLPQDVIEAAIKLATLPAAVRHDFAQLIDTMASSGYPAYVERVSTYSSHMVHDCAVEK
jgi:transcriptional regulator with XRE-family HTH domain